MSQASVNPGEKADERQLLIANLASDTQSARTEPESRLKCFLGIASIPLFTTGCPIIEVNHLAIKYLQYFVMFWSFWTGFYRIYDFIDFAIHKLDSNHILYSIYLYSLLGMIIGPTLLFVFKKYRILAFADGLWFELPDEARTRFVWTTSVAISISFCIRTLKAVWFVFACIFDKLHNWPFKVKKFFMAFIDRDIFVCYVVVYMLFVLLLKQHIIHVLTKLQERLDREKSSQKISCDDIHERLEKLVQNNREFEKIFSLLPFLWVLYNFTSASATFYAPAWKIMRDFGHMKYVFIFNYLCVFLMILFVCHTRTSVKEEINKTRSFFVVNRNLTNNSCETVTAIHRNMDILSALQFTAWDIFSLEKAVILSFTGTVMTFTVLFIKLSKETIT